MLKKRLTAAVLAVVVLISLFAGCGAVQEDSGVKKFGSTDSRDPLRICVDVYNFASSDDTQYNAVLKELAAHLQSVLGIEDIVIEALPSPYTMEGPMNEGSMTVRATAIDRMRVEIMSGDGPDVFIMTYMTYADKSGIDYDGTDVLFKYPEKAMENGIFLPLDTYIENNTQYAEWEKFTQAVLEAGRNEEGQQIIPLTYTMPVLCYPQSAFVYTPDRMLFYDDMLNDPELSPVAADLANCYSVFRDYETQEEIGSREGQYLPYILGDLADYEAEELMFTEEELLALVQQILDLEEVEHFSSVDKAKELNVGTQLSERTFNAPMTIIPLYSVDGGVTAKIQNYAAINRNTDRPEEAYAVVDYLMSRKMQKDSDLYTWFLYSFDGIPLHEDLFQPDLPLVSFNYYMTEENYQELCELRGQITRAYFDNEMTSMLSSILNECRYADIMEKTVEEIVHEAYVDMQRRMRE